MESATNNTRSDCKTIFTSICIEWFSFLIFVGLVVFYRRLSCASEYLLVWQFLYAGRIWQILLSLYAGYFRALLVADPFQFLDEPHPFIFQAKHKHLQTRSHLIIIPLGFWVPSTNPLSISLQMYQPAMQHSKIYYSNSHLNTEFLELAGFGMVRSTAK